MSNKNRRFHWKFEIGNLKLEITVLSLLFALCSLLFASAAHAATPTPTCQPIFGGGAYNCNGGALSVDKTVQDAQSGVYVQNLGVNDAHYSPESTVPFRIVIKNSGNTTYKNITIKDTLPKYLTYTAGDGKYDSKTNTLTITLSSLAGGKIQTYDVKAKVASVQNLPQDQAVLCVPNQVTVKSADQTLSDNAQFCIQRQAAVGTSNIIYPTPAITKGGQVIYPVTTNQNITKTPPTGPEALALFALAPLAGVGQFLRKKAIK